MKSWLVALGIAGAGVIAFLLKALKAKELEVALAEKEGTLKIRDARIKALEELRIKELAEWSERVTLLQKERIATSEVLAGLKAELIELEQELTQCTDPAVVRGRLNRLLGGGSAS
jgi:hypothetical protein